MQTVQRLFLVVAVIGLVGCKKADSNSKRKAAPLPSSDKTDQGMAAKPAHPSAPTPTPRANTATGAMRSGKVLETMAAGGYTYAKLDLGGSQVWVAGPQTTLAVGQQVRFSKGTVMRDFRSNTLKRTFPEILFVGKLEVAGAGAGAGAEAANPHGGSAPPNPHGAPAAVKANVGSIKAAPGGMRIADVFAKKAALAGKQVTIRGKVVKFNARIMGRNWLHIQDGSGAAGTNDLTVTTSDMTKVGDVVTVTGTLALNRKFGPGYSYPVIVEKAKIANK
jgi:hypothetical protein